MGRPASGFRKPPRDVTTCPACNTRRKIDRLLEHQASSECVTAQIKAKVEAAGLVRLRWEVPWRVFELACYIPTRPLLWCQGNGQVATYFCVEPWLAELLKYTMPLEWRLRGIALYKAQRDPALLERVLAAHYLGGFPAVKVQLQAEFAELPEDDRAWLQRPLTQRWRWDPAARSWEWVDEPERRSWTWTAVNEAYQKEAARRFTRAAFEAREKARAAAADPSLDPNGSLW